MVEDFRIHFSSDALLVIQQMRQLEVAALRAQNAINATQASSARAAAAGGGIATGSGAAALSPQLRGLEGQYARLQTRVAAIKNLGGDASREMQKLGVVAEQIALVGGKDFENFGLAQRRAAQQSVRLRGELDSTSRSFAAHSTRVGETVLIYAALATAAAGAFSAVSLASTIDTESRRLEAVLGLNAQQGRAFVGGILDTAVATATPAEDLIAQEDLIASAFANVSDEAERQRLALELTNRVGQTTTVTQRSVAQETENLIAIMKLGGLSVESLGVALGQVTAAGNNSSTSIAAILDALQIAIPGAHLAGVSLEQLIALVGLFRQQTQRDGSSIGSTFKTLFQTITGNEAAANLEEITGGLVGLRDEAGNLRPILDILFQIRALVDEGALSSSKLQDIFKVFAPQLQPGAAADIEIIFGLLDQLPTALREVETSGSDALDRLVDKLNAALGPQFRILIEEAKKAAVDLLQDDIVAAGGTVIDLVRSLGAALDDLDPDTLRAVAGMLSLAVAMKGAAFIGGNLLSLLGVRGITGALATAEVAAAKAGAQVGFMASAGVGLAAVLSRVLPLLVAFAAIDLAQQVGGQQEALKAQIGGLATGLDRQGLLSLRARLESQKGPGFSLSPFDQSFIAGGPLFNVEGGLKAFSTDPALDAGIAEIDRLLSIVGDGTVAADDLGDGFTGAADASKEVTDAVAEQAASLKALIEQYSTGTEAATGFSNANDLLATLVEEQAAAYLKLDDAVQQGEISLEEHAQGVERISQVSQQAAELVALHGAALGQIPQLAGAAAAGEEELTSALFNQLLGAESNAGALNTVINQLLNLGSVHAKVADFINQNPIIVRVLVHTQDLASAFRGTPAGGVFGQISNILSRQQGLNTFRAGASLLGGGIGSFNNLADQFSRLLTTGTSPTFNPGPAGSAGSAGSTRTPSVDLFDLGDFSADKLAEAIALAFRLQGSIPGGTEAGADDLFAIIKDAQFLQQVAGLDDELLRKSIEELTDVERARLELEQSRQNILQNLQVNTGPLSSLVSQPFLFAGGGIATGTGLNQDPRQLPFNVNISGVNINESLSAAEFEQLVMRAISKALADSQRL